MKIITVNSSKKYDVIIGNDVLSNAGKICSQKIGVCKGAVITDTNVDPLYSNILINSLKEYGYEIVKFVFEAGEQSKNSKTLVDILEFLAKNELTRSDCVFALGGGVVGDIAGFASAVYLRGIKFVQIPTTLLAAVDSSVGGKTGIDLASGKNLAGAFHQPSLVICDHSTLLTLSDDVFADGCAEVIKYGVINDRHLFSLIQNGIRENLEEIIACCVTNKRNIVEADEFDTGKRQLLNLGHTIGHSIEKLSDFKITHGSAVAIGMVVITKAAINMGICEKGALDSLTDILKKNSLPISCKYSATELATVALSDKKRSGNTITVVVPYAIGDSRLLKMSVEELENFVTRGIT